MPINDYLSPDGLYRQGLQHFNRGEWQDAIDAFGQVETAGAAYPDVAELVADARLKLRLESAEPPAPMAPPRGPLLMRVMLTALLCLLLVAGFEVLTLVKSAQPAVAAVARALPTPVPPTATAEPDVVPEATAVAAAAPETTAAPGGKGTVLIAPADAAAFVNTPSNIEIIVDASGSMYSKVPGTGKTRYQIAQDALMSLIVSNTIAPESYVAVRTYGRNKGGDCKDLELAQPLKRFKGDALAGVVVGIKPAVGGMTPLGASLQAAAGDLQAAEGSTVLILVTDGLESCNGDPVAAAASFVKDSPQRKVHVIGFAIDDPAASNNLRQIATTGHGLYFDAGNTAQLTEALRQTIVLTYRIAAQDGTQVATGTVGQGAPLQLQPGTYKLKINANPPIEKDLVVDSGGHVEVRLRQGYSGMVADVKSDTPGQ